MAAIQPTVDDNQSVISWDVPVSSLSALIGKRFYPDKSFRKVKCDDSTSATTASRRSIALVIRGSCCLQYGILTENQVLCNKIE